MPGLTFQLATVADLRGSFRRLAEPDRPMYEPEIWQKLQGVVEELYAAKRIWIFALEETGPESLFKEARAMKGPSLVSAIFAMVAQGRRPFLAPKQIAKANGEAALTTLDLLGTPDVDLTSSGPVTACHSGYRTREIWSEFTSPMAAQFMTALGFRAMREGPGAGESRIAWRAQPVCSEARGWGFRWPGRMLEHALLGAPDDRIATAVGLSEDG